MSVIPNARAGLEPSLAILHSDETYALGTFDRYLLATWRKEVSMLGALHWGRALGELCSAQAGRPTGSLTFMEPDCTYPTQEPVESTFGESMGRYSAVLRATATVYPRDGFWGAALRGQVTSVHRDLPVPIRFLVTTRAEDAASWLVETLAEASSERGAALNQALNELRAAPVTPR